MAKANDTQKKIRGQAKDSPSEDKPSRGQGQECSRPRTKDTGGKCSPKKRSLQKFFWRSQKIGHRPHFLVDL